MSSNLHTKNTVFKYDCIRGLFNGIVFSGLLGLSILIAIRYYNAPAPIKSLIASSPFIGRFLAPIILSVTASFFISTTKLSSIFMALTGLTLSCIYFCDNYISYSAFLILSYISFAQPPIFMLQVYADNYLPAERGKKVSTMFLYSTLAGCISDVFVGKFLDTNIHFFKFAFLFLALNALVSSYFLTKIPSSPPHPETNPLYSLKKITQDSLFAWLTVAYILLSIGISMVRPIFIEYMANAKYNLNSSNFNVLAINVIIPGIIMVFSTKIWGHIFDKYHLVTTRLLMNVAFIASFIVFFNTRNLYFLTLSSVLNGFATTGAMIFWNLWVIKLAPPKEASIYMAAFSCMSGLQGIFSQFLAYSILTRFSPQAVGYTASALITFASIMFILTWKNRRLFPQLDHQV